MLKGWGGEALRSLPDRKFPLDRRDGGRNLRTPRKGVCVCMSRGVAPRGVALWWTPFVSRSSFQSQLLAFLFCRGVCVVSRALRHGHTPHKHNCAHGPQSIRTSRHVHSPTTMRVLRLNQLAEMHVILICNLQPAYVCMHYVQQHCLRASRHTSAH